MSKSSVQTKAGGDSLAYVGYRGDLLAQLALSRLPQVDVFRPQVDGGWDYLVATPDGVCFAVVIQAYSSTRRHMDDVAALPDLRWRLDRQIVDRARASRTPVMLFLFDADTEHGRYLRLDTLAAATDSRTVTVSLPLGDTIDANSLGELLADLRRGPAGK